MGPGVRVKRRRDRISPVHGVGNNGVFPGRRVECGLGRVGDCLGTVVAWYRTRIAIGVHWCDGRMHLGQVRRRCCRRRGVGCDLRKARGSSVEGLGKQPIGCRVPRHCGRGRIVFSMCCVHVGCYGGSGPVPTRYRVPCVCIGCWFEGSTTLCGDIRTWCVPTLTRNVLRYR
jgi:hypothetical protein